MPEPIFQNLAICLLVHLYQSQNCIQTLKICIRSQVTRFCKFRKQRDFHLPASLPACLQEQTYRLNYYSIPSREKGYFNPIKPLLFQYRFFCCTTVFTFQLLFFYGCQLLGMSCDITNLLHMRILSILLQLVCNCALLA